MKLVLAAMCGLMALFMGGCAILSVVAMPFPLLPGAVAFLNLAMLAVLFNWKNLQWRPAFYILGVIDVIVAGFLAVVGADMGPTDRMFFFALGAAFLLKGVLSFVYAKKNDGAAK